MWARRRPQIEILQSSVYACTQVSSGTSGQDTNQEIRVLPMDVKEDAQTIAHVSKPIVVKKYIGKESMIEAVDFIATSMAYGFIAWILARVVDRTVEKQVSIRLFLNACVLFAVHPETLPALFGVLVFMSSQKWM